MFEFGRFYACAMDAASRRTRIADKMLLVNATGQNATKNRPDCQTVKIAHRLSDEYFASKVHVIKAKK